MNVFIIHSEIESAKTLAEIFEKRGDNVDYTIDIENVLPLLEEKILDLAVVDLHLPESALFELLQFVRVKFPQANILISNRYPHLERELEVKEYGVSAFVRAPFTQLWVERALQRLEHAEVEIQEASSIMSSVLPKVRLPVQLKIIMPYLVLAFILVLGAGYLISRVTLDSIENRFVNNLIEVGKLTSSWMVEEENRRLETLRLLTFTEGLDEAVLNRDSERLRELVLGVAINNQEEAIEILDAQGESLLSARHLPGGGLEEFEFSRGNNEFDNFTFVQNVLNQQIDESGDKFAGMVREDWGDYLYICGPIYAEDDQFVGAILVGRSLPTLILETRDNILGEENTFAHITIYNKIGQLMATTLIQDQVIDISGDIAIGILKNQDENSQLRPLDLGDINYREILNAWEVRGGEDLGIIGTSLAENFLVQPSVLTQLQIFILATTGFVIVITIGILLARRITNPLMSVVAAASQISQGEWDVSVEPQGNDELAFLGHAFNYMVSNLREGTIYRDLLGRAVSPQVRDQLRHGLASGELKLEGQRQIATTLITDIRDFTNISEQRAPTTILSWLNRYYGEMVPIVNSYDGITHEFTGDSMMAVFGILPTVSSSSKSAYDACRAAVNIIEAINILNDKRIEDGEHPFITGIGINTGIVAAGSMGSDDRLHYAVIGDTVNVTARLESLTKDIGETSAIISQDTYDALGAKRDEFILEPMGSQVFKGKSDKMNVYRISKLNQTT